MANRMSYGTLLKAVGPMSESVRRRGAAVKDVSVDEDVLHDAEAEQPLRYERW